MGLSPDPCRGWTRPRKTHSRCGAGEPRTTTGEMDRRCRAGRRRPRHRGRVALRRPALHPRFWGLGAVPRRLRSFWAPRSRYPPPDPSPGPRRRPAPRRPRRRPPGSRTRPRWTRLQATGSPKSPVVSSVAPRSADRQIKTAGSPPSIVIVTSPPPGPFGRVDLIRES